MDPFTWVSQPVSLPEHAPLQPTNNPTPASRLVVVKEHNEGFAIPALPPHLHPSTQINLPTSGEGNAPIDTEAKGTPPKSTKHFKGKKPFPAEHIPELLALIEGSTKTKLHLGQELAAHFKVKGVPKYSVDDALNEVAASVKEAAGKTWRVKEHIWVSEDQSLVVH